MGMSGWTKESAWDIGNMKSDDCPGTDNVLHNVSKVMRNLATQEKSP